MHAAKAAMTRAAEATIAGHPDAVAMTERALRALHDAQALQDAERELLEAVGEMEPAVIDDMTAAMEAANVDDSYLRTLTPHPHFEKRGDARG
jgi:uncharacterized protein (DUF305 family)